MRQNRTRPRSPQLAMIASRTPNSRNLSRHMTLQIFRTSITTALNIFAQNSRHRIINNTTFLSRLSRRVNRNRKLTTRTRRINLNGSIRTTLSRNRQNSQLNTTRMTHSTFTQLMTKLRIRLTSITRPTQRQLHSRITRLQQSPNGHLKAQTTIRMFMNTASHMINVNLTRVRQRHPYQIDRIPSNRHAAFISRHHRNHRIIRMTNLMISINRRRRHGILISNLYRHLKTIRRTRTMTLLRRIRRTLNSMRINKRITQLTSSRLTLQHATNLRLRHYTRCLRRISQNNINSRRFVITHTSRTNRTVTRTL